MTDAARKKLEEIIKKDLADIDSMKPDSEEREKATAALEKLIQLDIANFEAEARATKDQELVKVEKRKAWLEFGAKAAGVAVTGFGIVATIWADRNGWFVSKLGLGMLPKPKI